MERYSGFEIKLAVGYPDQLREPLEKEIEHEKMRVQTMEDVSRRLKTVKDPQKMFAFAKVLSEIGKADVAERAYAQLRQMGYDQTGKRVASVKLASWFGHTLLPIMSDIREALGEKNFSDPALVLAELQSDKNDDIIKYFTVHGGGDFASGFKKDYKFIEEYSQEDLAAQGRA